MIAEAIFNVPLGTIHCPLCGKAMRVAHAGMNRPPDFRATVVCDTNQLAFEIPIPKVRAVGVPYTEAIARG